MSKFKSYFYSLVIFNFFFFNLNPFFVVSSASANTKVESVNVEKLKDQITKQVALAGGYMMSNKAKARTALTQAEQGLGKLKMMKGHDDFIHETEADIKDIRGIVK